MVTTVEEIRERVSETISRDATRENPNEQRFAEIEQATRAAVAEGRNPGDRVALSILAVAATRGQGPEAALRHLSDNFGEKNMASEIERTMSQTSPKAGGLLVPERWSDEIIPLVREKTIVLSLGVRTLENPTGDLSLARVASAMKSYWKAPEGGKIKTTTTRFGRLRLRDKSLTAMVPVYNKLLRSASNLRGFIRDELGTTFGIAIDRAALFGSGGEDEPAGLFSFYNGKDDDSKTDANVVDLSTFTADSLVDVLEAHHSANGTLANPCWVMSPSVWAKLMKFQYENGGGYVFRDEMAAGTLMGIPFKFSTIVEDKSPTEGRLLLADWNEFILAPSRPMEFLESNVGGYYAADGSVVPVMATDETVIRAIWGGDMGPRVLQSFTLSNNVDLS